MRIGAVAPALLLAACASGSPSSAVSRPDQTVRVVSDAGVTSVTTTAVTAARVGEVPRPAANVWADLPRVLRSLGIEVTHLDSEAVVAGNEGFRVRRRLGETPLSRFLDCGRTQDGANTETYEVTIAVMTQLTPSAEGGTTVSTVVQATARPIQFSGSAVVCSSRGELENRILVALAI